MHQGALLEITSIYNTLLQVLMVDGLLEQIVLIIRMLHRLEVDGSFSERLYIVVGAEEEKLTMVQVVELVLMGYKMEMKRV
jgi:hypothetical protein